MAEKKAAKLAKEAAGGEKPVPKDTRG